MKFSRRDLLVWGAGAAAGLVVTPVPWKLLDDTSKWSQNWPWIPQPSRGPVEVKQSACTLCPNGCGLRVRMAGGWPIGVAGVPNHPVTRGALCPLAFGAHQLNWHPDRLRSVRHRGNAASWEDAHTAFAKACAEGHVVVIDGYPGRAASAVMQSFAEKRGEYRVVYGAEMCALAAYEDWSGVPISALGYDLENTRTIISFNAPLLNSWGAPGRFTRLWAERAAGQSEPQLRVIQIESSLSTTAAKAYQWIKIHPGSESALATGIARTLLEENLVASSGPIPAMTLQEVASATGLHSNAIRELARTLVAQRPVLAITKDKDSSVSALNVVLGAVGTRGGIVRRSKAAKAYAPADVTLGSARAVVLDASVPWNFAPQTDAEVFRFAAWNGGPGNSDWLLPAPGFLEELTDVPTAPTEAVETYALAAAMAKPMHRVRSCAEFLADIDPGLSSPESVIRARCANLFRRRFGTLVSQSITPVAKIASAQNLQEQLRSGAVWVGEPASGETIRCAPKPWPAADAGWPFYSRTSWTAPVMPPLASKLYQESGLREFQPGRKA